MRKKTERETRVGVLGREGLVHLNKLVRDDCIGSYLLSKYFHLLLCHHHPILIHMHLLSTLSYLFYFATLCWVELSWVELSWEILETKATLSNRKVLWIETETDTVVEEKRGGFDLWGVLGKNQENHEILLAKIARNFLLEIFAVYSEEILITSILLCPTLVFFFSYFSVALRSFIILIKIFLKTILIAFLFSSYFTYNFFFKKTKVHFMICSLHK